MRKTMFIIFLFSFLFSAGQSTYYLSPTGNDGNAGTIGSPWFTLNKAWTVIAPGDVVYMRGGIYQYVSSQILTGENGTAGNTIKIYNYPGEKPRITEHSSYVIQNGVDQDLIYFEGNYFHWKGLEMYDFEHVNGENPWPAFRAGTANYCTFELIDYHDNAAGFSIRGNSTGNLVLNSDFYRNSDPFSSPAYDGADGLDLHYIDAGTINTVRGCRAWWNSDDGFDFWENNGYVLCENNLSFYNGFLPGTFTTAGNGGGYKMGSTDGGGTGNHNIHLRTVRNCVGYRNRNDNFIENDADCIIHWYNNVSALAGRFGFWDGWDDNTFLIRNNVSYSDNDHQFGDESTIDNNSWQDATVTAGDFVSIDPALLLLPRNADGSLAATTFFRLAPGSDLIDAGVNVGLPFIGSNPDIGAFEFGTDGLPPTAVNVKNKKRRIKILKQ